ncbi:hypothetical protein Gotri_027417, partial [Gossypium trilobum]|nr:hypothetical protein [Gossypium trilobum]
IEKIFLNKVKDNVAVRIWSEKTQQEKGDNLKKGYMSELWGFTRIKYSDLPYLLDVKVNEHLFRALA